MSAFIHTSCDAAMAAAIPPKSAASHPNLILATTILASSLAFIDGSVVNVGLPAIRASFGVEGALLQWIINGYLLPLSALLLLGGAVGDRFGRARLLVLGILIFTFASMLCAASQSISWLIFGRVVQGIGAAILLPNSLAILADAFAGAQRGRAIGVWAAAAAIVGAVGPVLGGWLIDTVGWRAIFLLNIPLAIAAIVLTFLFIKDSQSGSIGVRLDTFGGVLATVGLGALTWALTMGAGREGWTFPAFIAFAVGGLAMFAFVWFESKQGERAMMPLTLFGSKMFVGLTLLTFFLYGALGGLMVLLPYVLIESEYHYSGTAAGAALLPFPLVIALGSPAMGWLADRIGPRWPLTVGSAVAAAGYCLMLRIDGAGSYWTAVFPAVLVVSIGMAMAVAPLTNAVLASVDAAHTGSASGFNSAVSRVGGLIATALLGASLGTSGQELIVSSHAAALIGTGMAAVASASAFLLVRDQ